MDWTEEDAIFDLVESLQVPSFGWDETEEVTTTPFVIAWMQLW